MDRPASHPAPSPREEERARLPARRAQHPLRLIHLNSAEKWVGEAAHSVDVCVGLAERGHRVIWGGRGDTPVIGRARAAGLETLALRMPSRFNWLGELADLRVLRDAIARQGTDVLHAHRGKDHWVAAAALWGWRPRRVSADARNGSSAAAAGSGGEGGAGRDAPHLFRTRHVVMPVRRHPFNRWIYTALTDQLVAVSRGAAQSLGPYWERARAARIILSGVDLEKFHPRRRDVAWKRDTLGIPAGAPLVGLVGRVQRIKGQQVFLEAARALAARVPAAHFVCAGRASDDRRALLQEGAEATEELRGRWHVLGQMDDIERFIATLDVGVVASLGSEGSSRVTLEYLASGLPVVASRVGGIPDVAEAAPGLALHLVEPGDVAALADQIGDLLARTPEAPPERIGYAREALAPISQERWLDDVEAMYYAHLPEAAGDATGARG